MSLITAAASVAVVSIFCAFVASRKNVVLTDRFGGRLEFHYHLVPTWATGSEPKGWSKNHLFFWKLVSIGIEHDGRMTKANFRSVLLSTGNPRIGHTTIDSTIVIEGEGAEAYSIEILSDSAICRVAVIDIAHDDPTEVLEMYVEDVLGLQPGDPRYNKVSAKVFPSRRVKRAKWTIKAGGCRTP